MSNQSVVFQLSHLKKSYVQGSHSLDILKDINLELKPGELVALVGSSGSGKSTLLHIAGLLEPPTQGSVLINGQDAWAQSDAQRTALRRDHIGFVYQFHHLLPEFSAQENVALPQIMKGISRAKAMDRALALLKTLGLEDRATHRPSRLSGGEQQRVAILRAMANNPHILLADEPTGNLDEETAQRVLDELIRLVREQNVAALIVTHDLSLAQKMDRIYHLTQGALGEKK